MVVRNKYKVPVKTWRKWSQRARYVFNDLYSSMTNSPFAFRTPALDKVKLTARQWKVTAWNAAWMAADAVRDYDREVV